MDIFPDDFVFLRKFFAMKKTLLLLLLTVAGLAAQAQIPNGYYNSANGKTGDELRSALHEIIKDHTTISYQQIWSAFWSTDNKGNNVVWDMYSDGANYTYNYYQGNVNDQCGSYEQEGDCFNREHSWPKSWFSGDEQTVPGRDLHHIFPTDGFVNAQRSSYPYGEVNHASWTSQNGSKLGTCKSSLGYTGTVFEPIDEYKGDLARAYFYMSTRYYGEDASWGTSGMTNKADIKPWAIDMLLDWSDNDPVSQKEIDRNNVIYGIQGNRNPFIDHPEYAHIIWEPGWTGVTYNITTASVQHGSISAPATAVEGTMVTLTATPAQGYMLGSWSVYKTDDANTIVAVSSNGTFTMPSFNVTVSASFVPNSTLYDITCATGLSNGSIGVNVSSATSGTGITLSNTPADGYTLYSYYVYKTGDLNTIVYSGTGNNFTMPAFDVTVSASFVQPTSYTYVKVTEEPSNGDWSGEYLMVCESQGVAFNGTVDNDWGRCSSVTISNQAITSTSTTDGYKVTISKNNSEYKFLFPSGKYMSWTGEKKFSQNNTGQSYSISISNGDVSISYNGLSVKYNHNSGNGGLRSYASGQTAIQLYKKTSNVSAPTHTIQFNPNGASGLGYTQNVNEFEPTALQPNTFTRTGFAFDSWNTAANGSGTTYFDGATVTLLNDLTLYAQWKPLYTITVGSIANGTVNVSANQAMEGAIITLSATPASGYEFDHWTVVSGSSTIAVVENEFEMPAGDVTVSASFVYVGEPFTQKYHLVTSTDQLIAGREYLIVNTAAGKAMGTTQNTKNRAAVDVTVNSNTIESIGTTVCELTLWGETGAWILYDSLYSNTGGYLYAASSSENYLKTQTTNDANGLWSISIASNGVATIVAQGTNTRNHLRYNTSGLFSCYASDASTSQMPLVSLFIRSEEYPHDFSETVATILPFDKHTVASGATLTVTGTATCNDPALLVIEDGGQFIHHNDGVKATFKKAIAAYTSDSDGWYTIASPFTALTPSQVGTDSYDLFAYLESGNPEWLNYKNHQSTFATFTPGNGYLYAHNPGTTLRMTGTLNNGDYTETINLSYANSQNDIKGCNLLGNPTAHSISFTKSGSVSDGYYYLYNSGVWAYEPTNTVPAGRGFFVKANAEGQTVTLNPSAKRGGDEAAFLHIDVDGEHAYVKLSEGVSMPLIDFRGRHSGLYLTREGKNYIMLVNDNAPSADLCYQPEPGQHRLSVDAEGMNLNYLHLIDHLTGNDIDLLTTPSYRFESSSSDYTTRFRLVFDPDEVASSDDVFAYVGNGQIIITGITGNETLQVIDAVGRTIVSAKATSSLSTDNMAPGVYVLKLVSGNGTKVQKIMVF